MRKLALALVVLIAVATKAQTNLQVHYDFGKDRSYVTTTLEMFKPDKWGNTFFFVDFDYNMGKENHPCKPPEKLLRHHNKLQCLQELQVR